MLSRETEVARLEEALPAAASGAGSLVVVTGAPGIGKTTLLGAAQSVATGADMLVRARGVELEQLPPRGRPPALRAPARRGRCGAPGRAAQRCRGCGRRPGPVYAKLGIASRAALADALLEPVR